MKPKKIRWTKLGEKKGQMLSQREAVSINTLHDMLAFGLGMERPGCIHALKQEAR